MRKTFMGVLCLFAPFALALAEGFETDAKGFVHDWLIGGPYPSYWVDAKPKGYDEDFLGKLGGEAQARPYEGLEDKADFIADTAKLIAGIGSTNEWGYTETKTFPVAWKALHSEKPSISLDNAFLPLKDHIVSYALCYVVSPVDAKVKLRVGSDDDNKVYLNGKLAGSFSGSQGVVPDNFIYPGELKRGLNRILVKIVNRTHGYGFCLALSDASDKPLSGLKVLLEHPERTLMASNRALAGVDVWDAGYYASLKFPTATPFTGRRALRVQCGVPAPGDYKFELGVKVAGRSVLSETREASLAPGKLLELTPAPELPSGKGVIVVRVFRGGALVADMAMDFTVLDPAKLKAGTEALRKEIQAVKADLSAAKDASPRLDSELSALDAKRAALYSKIEAAYEARRAKLVSNPKPVDEPLKAASVLRSRLCLNGDQWLIGAPGKNGARPPLDKMRPIRVPVAGLDSYFRSWLYPVSLEDPKNMHGRLKPARGWEDYKFEDLLCKKAVWLRRAIELDEREVAGKSWTLLFESGLAGRTTVYFNGVECGSFEGMMGRLECPLSNVKPGENTLEIHAENVDFDRHHGWWAVNGDVYLDSASPVKVESAVAKSSWRDAKLSVSSVLENRSSAMAKVLLDQYCVLDGGVKYRLPSQKTELAPGAKTTLKTEGVWTEAKPWGIGGKYGEPVLYELVSDLYVDGKLVDRLVEPFGFREFWIAGSDFYLNGKRIILHGDVGFGSGAFSLHNKKVCEVVFPLLRADGVNTIRNHDSTIWSEEFLRSCDRLGMLVYAQMHPVIDVAPQKSIDASKGFEYTPYDEWMKHPIHNYNLRDYYRWVELLRAHPSVVIASTDNEIFTQAWDNPARLEYNIRNDKVGAFYGRYVKSLEPSLVITRDGDEGTWGGKGKWQEEPPCDTANYHYPDFNIGDFVMNWQSVYEFRPAVFGETLYYSYGAWDKWIGAIPSQVHKKSMRVREVAALYERLGVPGQIYMGPVSDCFVLFDDSGKGNPWGVTASMHDARKKDGPEIPALPGYPWLRVDWPAMNGPGLRFPAASVDVKRAGTHALNWFDPTHPSHVRNEVNDAYRDSLSTQPPLAAPSDAECVVSLGEAGRGRRVKIAALDALGGALEALADSDGKVWFVAPRPGRYRVECGASSKDVDLPSRASYAAKPGFDSIPKIQLDPK